MFKKNCICRYELHFRFGKQYRKRYKNHKNKFSIILRNNSDYKIFETKLFWYVLIHLPEYQTFISNCSRKLCKILEFYPDKLDFLNVDNVTFGIFSYLGRVLGNKSRKNQWFPNVCQRL